MPSGRRAPHTVLAGGGSGKNWTYTSFMLGASSMLCSSTLTFTILSKEEPARSSSCSRLVRICRVSLAVVPGMHMPDCGSVAVRPDTNRKSPPRTACDAAALAVRLPGCCGEEMISRLALIASLHSYFAHVLIGKLVPTFPGHALRGSHSVDLNLESGLDLHRPNGARRRSARDVLPVDAVEHVIFDAVVNERMHLHEPVERGAGRLQEQLQIAEDDVRLAGERAVAALAGLGIDRKHSGTEDQAAGADRRRLMMPVMLSQIEPGTGHGDDFAHGTNSRINPKAVRRRAAGIARYCPPS